MVPDRSLEAKQVEEEATKLAAIKSAMSDAELEAAIEETKSLKAAQAQHDSAQDLASIPSLGLEDLDPNQLELPNEVSVSFCTSP